MNYLYFIEKDSLDIFVCTDFEKDSNEGLSPIRFFINLDSIVFSNCDPTTWSQDYYEEVNRYEYFNSDNCNCIIKISKDPWQHKLINYLFKSIIHS